MHQKHLFFIAARIVAVFLVWLGHVIAYGSCAAAHSVSSKSFQYGGCLAGVLVAGYGLLLLRRLSVLSRSGAITLPTAIVVSRRPLRSCGRR
jgi:hypothetical protein